jgi:hypothetical protein
VAASGLVGLVHDAQAEPRTFTCEPHGAISSLSLVDRGPNDLLRGTCASSPEVGAGAAIGPPAAAGKPGQEECHQGSQHGGEPGREFVTLRCPARHIATRMTYDAQPGCQTGAWRLFCAPLPDDWIKSPKGIEVVNGLTAMHCADCPTETLRLSTVLVRPKGRLRCVADPQTTVVGKSARLRAKGGDGRYRWSSLEANPTGGSGALFTPVYHAPGTYAVSVSDGGGKTETCMIAVTTGAPGSCIQASF